MKVQNYPLIRLWDAMMGSSPSYSGEQVAWAAQMNAPQTALSVTRKEHRSDRSGNPRLHKWVDRDGNEWTLFSEYLPADTQLRLRNLCKQRYSMELADLLKSLGYEQPKRAYADVHARVGMEVDIEAWMAEYGVDREHALEQIRTDIVTAIKVTFMHDKWTGLVDDVEATLGMEA